MKTGFVACHGFVLLTADNRVLHHRNKSHVPFRSRSHRMPPSDVRERHEYLDLSSKSPGSHVQLSTGLISLSIVGISSTTVGWICGSLPPIGRMRCPAWAIRVAQLSGSEGRYTAWRWHCRDQRQADRRHIRRHSLRGRRRASDHNRHRAGRDSCAGQGLAAERSLAPWGALRRAEPLIPDFAAAQSGLRWLINLPCPLFPRWRPNSGHPKTEAKGQ